MPRATSEELTATQLGDVLGVSGNAVTNWKAAGMPHRMKSGRPVYVIRDVVRWFREEEQKKAREAAGLPDKLIEEARKMRAQADMAEMERDERAGLLVRRESVEAAQLKENTRARTKLLAIPNAHAQRLADDLGVPVRAVAKALDRVVREVLEELAREDDDDELPLEDVA